MRGFLTRSICRARIWRGSKRRWRNGIGPGRGVWQSLRDPEIGFLTGGLVGLLLTGIFFSRFVRTRKFMPAGLVLLLSLLVGILTMVARQEYIHKRDMPAGELTQKRARDTVSGPTSEGLKPENQAIPSG